MEKHEYKYSSLHDKYGVDDLHGGDGHLVLPAAPGLAKHNDPYNPDSIAGKFRYSTTVDPYIRKRSCFFFFFTKLTG